MRKLVVAATVLALACSSESPATNPGGDDSGPSQDAGIDASTGNDGGDTGSGDACALGSAYCTGYNQRKKCADVGGSRAFVDETCAGGSGCVKGECVAQACSDEC